MYLKVIGGCVPRGAMIVPSLGVKLWWGNGSIQLKGLLDKIDTIDSAQSKSLGKAAAGVAAGGCLLGPLGAIFGGMASGNKHRLTLHCTLKDGREFYAEVDPPVHKMLLGCLT